MSGEIDAFPPGSRDLLGAIFSQRLNPDEREELEATFAGFLKDSDGNKRIWQPSRGHFAVDAVSIGFDDAVFVFDWIELRPPNREGRFETGAPFTKLRAYDGLQPEEVFDPWINELLASLAEMTWWQLQDRLMDRYARGDVSVWGRVGSPIGPVREILPDSWRHFQMIDWFRSVAVCEATGDKLFSVSVVDSTDKPVRRPPRDNDFVEFTEEALRAAARGEHITIEETQEWARQRGLNRDFVRRVRLVLPESAKLRPGEKRGDWRP